MLCVTCTAAPNVSCRWSRETSLAMAAQPAGVLPAFSVWCCNIIRYHSCCVSLKLLYAVPTVTGSCSKGSCGVCLEPDSRCLSCSCDPSSYMDKADGPGTLWPLSDLILTLCKCKHCQSTCLSMPHNADVHKQHVLNFWCDYSDMGRLYARVRVSHHGH